MKNIFTICLAILLFTLVHVGCGQDSNQQKELELKEKELQLKEKELQLKEDSIKGVDKNEKPNSIKIENDQPKTDSKIDKTDKVNNRNPLLSFIGQWIIGDRLETIKTFDKDPDGRPFFAIIENDGEMDLQYAIDYDNNYEETDDGIRFSYHPRVEGQRMSLQAKLIAVSIQFVDKDNMKWIENGQTFYYKRKK